MRKISVASRAIASAMPSSMRLPLSTVACSGLPYQPVGAMVRKFRQEFEETIAAASVEPHDQGAGRVTGLSDLDFAHRGAAPVTSGEHRLRKFLKTVS